MEYRHTLSFVAAVCLSLSLVAAEYRAATVEELTNALNRISCETESSVLTLAPNVYDLSSLPKMHADALLSVSNGVVGRAVVIQGDPASAREQVVLDAGRAGRVLRAFNYSYGQMTFRNLTFRNGLTTEPNGGVQTVHWGTFTFTNCVFAGNQANGSAAAAGGFGERRFRDCLFKENLLGGGYGLGGVLLDPTEVTGCVFERNGVYGDQIVGAVVNGSCDITDCVFDSNVNTGRWGKAGAVYLKGGNAVACVFTNNYLNESAEQVGAALVLASTAEASSVIDCTFVDNRCEATGDGGAIACAAMTSTGEIRGCTFVGNGLSSFGSRGGAVANFPGLLTNCTFVGNEAYYGGAVYACSNVVGCTFRANHADNIDGLLGGGAAFRSVLRQCSVVSNTATYSAGGVCESAAYGCAFTGNTTSAFRESRIAEAMDSFFEDCEFFGSEGYGVNFKNCGMNRCFLHDNGVKLENCTGYLFDGQIAVTNSLLVGNTATRLFSNYAADLPNAVINCTFVGNRYDILAFNGGTDAAILFANNLFVDNGTYTWAFDDDVAQIFDGMTFRNNYLSTTFEIAGADNVNVRYESLNPRLMRDRDPERPWAPRRRSPLNGAGLVMDWMSNATDFDGHPRLTDGRVAIGACETTEPCMGALILIR